MTWETIHDYLRKVAKAADIPVGNTILVRQELKPVVITHENWNNGYLKPDYGFSSRLNKYQVQDAATGKRITSWGLYQFPSCCAFCVSTEAFVETQFRGKHINTLSNSLRQEIARHEGYSALICTDVITNAAQRKTLATNGFKDIFQLRNSRTGNDVAISVKVLD